MPEKKTAKKKSKKKRRKSKVTIKRWKFNEELKILEEWEQKGIYEKYKLDPNSKKPIFSIDTPPPYPSGKWHIGAVSQYTMIDMIARIQRLRGYNVLFPWGLDRNGINIEFTVEKKYNKPLHEWERAEFIAKCKEEITKISNEIDRIAKRIGCSMDFEGHYKTDDPKYRAVTQRSFIELFKNGDVYEDFRPNNYDPSLKTTIADAEIYYSEGDIRLNYIKFPIKGREDLTDKNGYLLIATTRPELICACQIILVHPDDDRFKDLHGKYAYLPLYNVDEKYNRAVKIIPHPAASMEYGTGAVMICSYGDSTDVQLFRELELEPIAGLVLDDKGNVVLGEAAGKYQGMNVERGRTEIVDDLDAYGYLDYYEVVEHKYPVCERSGERIEIIMLKEYYIKQVEYLDELKKIADEMNFHPKKNKSILLDWINSITIDWPISRRRYYHTEIPVWRCKKCGEMHLPEPGPYYRPWCEEAPFKDEPCKKCGCKDGYIGEEKTFDTWMDSSNSSAYVIKYGQDMEFFKENHPCSLRPQGREIVRTWLYYTMLKNFLLFNKKPFEHVWISGLGMDQHGKKMSKTKGNVIDPDLVINKYGVDTFRYWAATVSHVGDDFRIDEEKIRNTGKIITKFFNIAKYVAFFEDKSVDLSTLKLKPIDKWILAELNRAIEQCTNGYDDFDFIVPAQSIRNFAVNLFASHYIEIAKQRAYEGDAGVAAVLHTCLKAILKILHPITPFITYKLYEMIYDGDIQFANYPELVKEKEVSEYGEYTEDLIGFNSLVWKEKHEKGISLKDPIDMDVSEKLKPFKEDLIAMHSLKKS
ncbi:MAG: valine--tRNA ligase [Candidatus Lokiarchaeota archaeon]|nr:valine--tRNA ligase [Candidatus Lokiarchaeota archaeon]